MRRIAALVGFVLVILLAAHALRTPELETPLPAGGGAPPLAPESEKAGHGGDSSKKPELNGPTSDPDTAREAISALELDEASFDPSTAIAEERDAALAALTEAQRTIKSLRTDLARVTRELETLKNGRDTPYGAFLESDEARDIEDPRVLAAIKSWLLEFPVFLRPGEASWIAEREKLQDWKLFARSCQEAVIHFLGPARLKAELPPKRLEEVLEEYGDTDYFR